MIKRDEVEALAGRMHANVKWKECDCGCPDKRSPADAVSVTWLRAASMVSALLVTEADSGGDRG